MCDGQMNVKNSALQFCGADGNDENAVRIPIE